MRSSTNAKHALAASFVSLLLSGALAATVHAEVDWTLHSTLKLEKSPLDVTSSADGKTVFVLIPGEVVIYDQRSRAVKGRLPVESDAEQITVSPRGNQLYVTNSEQKSVSVINVDFVFQIDVAGAPFTGPADAPVVVAVFDDYQ